MDVRQLATFYDQRKSQFAKSFEEVSSSINVISNLRLFVAVMFLITLYFGFTNPPLLYFLIVIGLVFVMLMRYHGKLFQEKTHLENLVKINDLELKALSGNRTGLDPGTEFINPHHPYSHDLDIFGEGSLFQFINRCNTRVGRKKMADRLAYPLLSKNDVVDQQQAINELAEKFDFRQHFQAAGKEIEEEAQDRKQLADWLTIPSFIYGKTMFKFLLVALPLVSTVLLIGLFFSEKFRPFVFLMAAVQWGILGFNIKRVNAFHEYIGKKKNILQKYAALLGRLESEKFTSALMLRIGGSASNAGKKVKQLADLVYAFDARGNSLMSIVVNSFVLYDLQYVYRLERWREENAGQLLTWLDATAETEVISSFGTFAFNNERFIYPSIQSTFEIAGEQVGHPLIPATESITNDFKIGDGENIMIVTGANMAGKSTFLRTIGINLILALNGAPVCAAAFKCPIINLRTGMRTADSLKDHQSYFYAELDRLKGIMDELRQNIPLLILLDEILKGTNSTDKQAGSIALVKQLLPHPCLAIIATHDLALGELENEFPTRVKNFHFEANIENDQLFFDYKLKRGIAQKMNATFLMKKMGIIPS
jgi:hypothetical protein